MAAEPVTKFFAAAFSKNILGLLLIGDVAILIPYITISTNVQNGSQLNKIEEHQTAQEIMKEVEVGQVWYDVRA